MPVLKMQKVALIAHRSLREDLLEFLQDRGVMEVSPNEDTTDIDHPEILYQEAQVQFALDVLQPYASKEVAQRMRATVSNDDIRHSAQHIDFRSVIDTCKELQEEKIQCEKEAQRCTSLMEQLQAWQDLPYNPSAHNDTDTTTLLLGSCPMTSWEALREEVQQQAPRSALTNVGGTDTDVMIAAIVWKEDQEVFQLAAARRGWSRASFPTIDAVPASVIAEAETTLSALESQMERIEEQKSDLAKHVPGLLHLLQYLHWMDEKQNVRSELEHTTHTVALQGWVAAKEYDALSQELEQKFSSVALMKIEPENDEEPPVQIRNRNSVAPFEAVTRLYGLPQSHEMDPTSPLALFFILSFGLCLTDAGYGIVLALLTGGLIWKMKLKKQEAQLVWLLFYAGIVTFFVSIPFGGWFGVVPADAPDWMTYTNAAGEKRFLGQIWDIQKDVDFFRNLALSIGGIQLLFGVFLAGYWKWVHGKRWEAIASHFSLHLFVATLVTYMFADVPGMLFAVCASGALFVWGQGSGPWWMRPLVGALGTVNFGIGMMSNILSYLRILALGLATGALAFAINQIATVISNLLPAALGIPVFVLILLVGHLISLALNGLGSFVHSGRLQFIEFFGQFFAGGGREFAPFRRIRSVIG